MYIQTIEIKKLLYKLTDQDPASVKYYESKVEQMKKNRARLKVMLHAEWEKIG